MMTNLELTAEHDRQINVLTDDAIEEVAGGVVPFWMAMVYISSTGVSYNIARDFFR